MLNMSSYLFFAWILTVVLPIIVICHCSTHHLLIFPKPHLTFSFMSLPVNFSFVICTMSQILITVATIGTNDNSLPLSNHSRPRHSRTYGEASESTCRIKSPRQSGSESPSSIFYFPPIQIRDTPMPHSRRKPAASHHTHHSSSKRPHSFPGQSQSKSQDVQPRFGNENILNTLDTKVRYLTLSPF